MQLPDELFTALNAQMNREQSNARFYEAAANRFETLFLAGFAKLMRSQMAGEVEHAAKVRDYLIDRNLEPVDTALSGETVNGGDCAGLFAQALAREVGTSQQWTSIYLLAVSADDVPTVALAHWFMTEQVEEERLATEWLGRAQFAGTNTSALLQLDAQAKGDQAMPWKIEKQNGKYAVVKESDGTVEGEHYTKEKAAAQLKALYASEKKSAEPEAMKVGAMISASNKAKLKAAHDAIRELYPECCKDGDADKEVPGESDNPVPDTIDSAGGKSTTLPQFSYVARLHLPHDEQFVQDVVACKSVARDTIRFYNNLWGSPNLPDVETEFFTGGPQTPEGERSNFWDTQLKGITRPLTYDHGQEQQTKADCVIGTIEEFGDDEIGRWAVAQLKRNHQYRKAVDGLISRRALGGSSDSASQYVVRKSAGKAVWLAQWPWFATALTTTPAEPRMLDVGLPYWKSAGVDFARMGAPDGAVEIPEALRLQAAILKAKAGVP